MDPDGGWRYHDPHQWGPGMYHHHGPPPWIDGLYADIRTALAILPPPPPPPKPKAKVKTKAKQTVSGRRVPAGSARTSRRASGARR